MRCAIVLSIVLLGGSACRADGFWSWSTPAQQASAFRANLGASGCFPTSFRYGAVVPSYGAGVAMVAPSGTPLMQVAAITNHDPSGLGHAPGLTPIFPPSNSRKRTISSPREEANRKVEAAREALASGLLGLARDHLQTARSLDPDNQITKLLLGQTLLMQGKYHAAAGVLRHVWTDETVLLPEMRGTLTGIADSQTYREALDRLESLRVRFPDDPEILFLEAQGRTLAGHDALARPHWKRLKNHPPDRIVAGRVLVQHHD